MRKQLKVCAIMSGFLLLAIESNLAAQIFNPVHWSSAYKKIGKNEVAVFLKATIDKGWHIYALNQKDGGPQKTEVAFSSSEQIFLEGNVMEPQPMTRFEKTFKMDVHYFEKSVIFRQKVKINAQNPTLSVNIKFMACTDHQCLPPDEIAFNIPIK